jgi:uncharacterized membrane protein YhhN
VQPVTVDLNRVDVFLGNWRIGIRHPVVLGILALASLYALWTSLGKLETPAVGAIVLAIMIQGIVSGLLLVFAVTVASAGIALIANRERGVLG